MWWTLVKLGQCNGSVTAVNPFSAVKLYCLLLCLCQIKPFTGKDDLLLPLDTMEYGLIICKTSPRNASQDLKEFFNATANLLN